MDNFPIFGSKHLDHLIDIDSGLRQPEDADFFKIEDYVSRIQYIKSRDVNIQKRMSVGDYSLCTGGFSRYLTNQYEDKFYRRALQNIHFQTEDWKNSNNTDCFRLELAITEIFNLKKHDIDGIQRFITFTRQGRFINSSTYRFLPVKYLENNREVVSALNDDNMPFFQTFNTGELTDFDTKEIIEILKQSESKLLSGL